MKTTSTVISHPVSFGDIIAFNARPESVELVDGVSMVGFTGDNTNVPDGKQWFVPGAYNFLTNVFTVGDGNLALVLIEKDLNQVYIDGGNWGLA